jgi:hypothetical protein
VNSRFQTCSGETRGVGEYDRLIVEISSQGSDTKIRGGKNIEANHPDSKCGLVGVQVVPLTSCQRAVVGGIIVVSDFADYDDTSVIGVCCGRIQQGKAGDPGLRHSEYLEGNAIASKASSCAILCRCRVACDDQDVARYCSTTDVG